MMSVILAIVLIIAALALGGCVGFVYRKQAVEKKIAPEAAAAMR